MLNKPVIKNTFGGKRMKPEAKSYEAIVGGLPITVETGKLAGQAGGAVTLRVGETLIFASATMSNQPRAGINFFPLSVDYEERMYAGGRIPGGFFRREGRPSEHAILTARLTDRPLRPLFPKDMRNDVQVIFYAISADDENPIDILGINAASAAIMISDIPWAGPVGAVRVGRVDGEFVINPSYDQMEASDLDLRLAGTREAILMVECGADEIPEDVMVEALELGHQSIQPLIDLQFKMAEEVGKAKRDDYPRFATEESIKELVLNKYAGKMIAALDGYTNRAELSTAISTLKTEAIEDLSTEEETGPSSSDVSDAFESVYKKVVRGRILNEGKRPDGRSTLDIRPIWCEVDFSPRAHGSGLFTRGETQILTLATLGTPRDAQEMDNLTPNNRKRYIHHYNFPPFSVGETRPLRGASRREVGHGALAERALIPVIPDEETFPYTLRMVSEALSSNGSTSMGSVCGSTLALMDAGVPITSPVSGIAMGLIMEGEKYSILSDIQGVEDHLGDTSAIWTSKSLAPTTVSQHCRWISKSPASRLRSCLKRFRRQTPDVSTFSTK
jgi:polyribonucleotide nucleotidyltransferase